MTTTARRRLHPRTLDDLAVLPRWVAWREEIRINKERKEYKAKIPYDPNTHQQARIPTEPSTWGSRDQAERRCRSLLHHRNAVGGVGIVLGEFDDGTLLIIHHVRLNVSLMALLVRPVSIATNCQFAFRKQK